MTTTLTLTTRTHRILLEEDYCRAVLRFGLADEPTVQLHAVLGDYLLSSKCRKRYPPALFMVSTPVGRKGGKAGKKTA